MYGNLSGLLVFRGFSLMLVYALVYLHNYLQVVGYSTLLSAYFSVFIM